jgi:hypothetical protein
MKHFLLYPFFSNSISYPTFKQKRFPFNTITHFSNGARYGKITR